MTEQALLNYFHDNLSADELAKDLKDSKVKKTYDTTSVYVIPVDNNKKFAVTREHLIKLTVDTLSGKLTPDDLTTIAFALISSDIFTLDDKKEDAEIIETVVYDWDNPEIGFDLSLENIQLWKEYLETGEYRLDKEELKAKFRNDRGRRNLDNI